MTEEDRLADLETRLAYQDETLHVLSDTIARQQKQIDQLEALCKQLLERLKSQAQALPPNSAEEELPPHY
jgi:SlyX protein